MSLSNESQQRPNPTISYNFQPRKPSFCEMQFRSSPVQPRPSACSVCPLATGGGSRVSPVAWYLCSWQCISAGKSNRLYRNLSYSGKEASHVHSMEYLLHLCLSMALNNMLSGTFSRKHPGLACHQLRFGQPASSSSDRTQRPAASCNGFQVAKWIVYLLFGRFRM